jgi:ubiquinone biosynthesis protein
MGGLGHTLRFLRVGWVLARHDALFFLRKNRTRYSFLHFLIDLLVWLTPRMGEAKNWSEGKRLAKALQALGPAFIKLGQTFATRADVVGEEIAAELMVLQDRLPSVPTEEIIEAIETGFDKPLDDLFAHFDPKPVAAASIAQVHFATTQEGEEVAVKVLRPGVKERIADDIRSFFWLAEKFEKYMKRSRRLKPTEVVKTMAKTIEIELDLRMEAAAASELAENMKGENGYRVPRVYWSRTAQNVLTLERITGIQLNDKKALKEAKLDFKALSETVVRVFLNQAMRDGFFHADLHQGNFFIEDDGTLVPVDFGIMGRLDKPSRRYLAEILYGFHERNYERVADVHFEAGYVPADQDRALFAQAMRALAEPIMDKPLSEVSFGDMLSQLFQTTERFKMETQPQLIVLQRSMMMVEGLAMTLDKDVNMWEVSRPVLKHWAGKLTGFEERVSDVIDFLRELFKLLPEFVSKLRELLQILGEVKPRKPTPEKG